MRETIIFMCALLLYIAAVEKAVSAEAPRAIEIKCPLCHSVFRAEAYVPRSKFGMRLDHKPLDSAAARWNMPKCLKCHFIVYEQEFSDKELDLLRNFVDSKDYRSVSAESPSYALLARIYEAAGKDPFEIAYAYLKASWQFDEDRAKCAKYLEAAYAKFLYFLSTNIADAPRRVIAELLSGEIERRLKKFELASTRFIRLKNSPEFRDSETVMEIISQQLELIEARDSEPCEIRM